MSGARSPAAVVFASVAGTAVVLAALAGIRIVGIVPVAALLVGLTLLVVFAVRLDWLLAGVVITTVLIEATPLSAFPAQTAFYAPIAGTRLVVTDFLFASAAFGLAMRARTRTPVVYGWGAMTVPMLLMAVAVGMALVTGAAAQGDPDVALGQVRPLAYIAVASLLVSNVLTSQRALTVAISLVAVLLSLKGIEGVMTALTGNGTPVTDLASSGSAPGGLAVAFPDAMVSVILLLLMFGALAAMMWRIALPPWIWLGALAATGAFLLSLRRSVWLGAIAALTVLFVFWATQSRSRGRVVVLALALLCVGLGVAFARPGADFASNPIVARAGTISTNRGSLVRGDRYRVAEQRNVAWNIRREPLTGLGVGVRWEAPYPLPLRFDSARSYSHVAFSYMWVFFGIPGAVAYMSLILVAAWTAFRTMLATSDRTMLVACTAALGVLVALAVSELFFTATVVSIRGSIILGLLIGFVAAAARATVATAASATLHDHRGN